MSETIYIGELPKNDNSPQRVAVYTRFPHDSLTEGELELAKSAREYLFVNHPDWKTAGYYYDLGKYEEQDGHTGLDKLLADCQARKIDRIVTRRLNGFTGRGSDSVVIVEELLNLTPPVGVEFETEHIYTLDDCGRMILAIISEILDDEKPYRKSHKEE